MNAADVRRRPRLSLAVRVFLLVAGLLIIAMGTAVFVSFKQGVRIAERSVSRTLESSSAVQSAFAEQRLKELELITQLIAVDPSFVNYIADSQDGASGDPLLAESNSIFDLLAERRDAYGFGLGIVLDAQGNVLARSDQPEAFEENISGDPFIAPSIQELTPISGFWRSRNTLYQAAVFPLDQGGDLVGFLLLARQIDRELGERIRAVSDADIAFLLPDNDAIHVAGTSLNDALMDSLMVLLREDTEGLASAVRNGAEVPRATLLLAGERWIARLRPLDREGGAAVGSALQLTSSDAAESSYRDILNTMGLTGLAAILIALPLTLLIVRAGLSPLRDMAQAAKKAAGGDYQARFEFGGGDELSDLSCAFDSLLSDLRGERDIESYVTHLSRLMPDPDEQGSDTVEGPKGLAPATEAMTLVAVEARQPAQTGTAKAEQTLGDLADLCSGIHAVAEEHGGRLLSQAGHRMLVGFPHKLAEIAPLRFVRELLQAEPSLAAAALQGEVTFGSLHGEHWVIPGATGVVVQQVERLLTEAPGGRLLLSPALGDRVKMLLGEGAVGVEKGQLSQRPYYAIAATGLAHVPDRDDEDNAEIRQISGFSIFAAAGSGHAGGANLSPGTLLGGRFRVISVLGSGGMGVVYKARDLELEDIVALKMLKGSALCDPEQLERLKSEIKLARRITHPNVLRTFDFGEFEGGPYISMEYVRGMTLRHLIAQSGKVPFTAALRIARQLCAGLQAAHEVGVLHRDIKPENLILEASGNAKLMDFGIARPLRRGEMAHQQEEGMYLGTPAYSAPEQLSGMDVDHRADIFASGAMLMEMFCGDLPFRGQSTVDIYVAQMQGELHKPSESWPEIPPALEVIILRCLERDVAARFQSAAELAGALAGIRA